MASSVTKKNSLCRYYIRYGDCFHGENCQYIHAHPSQESPQSQPATSLDAPPESVSQAASTTQHPGYSLNKYITPFKSGSPNEIDFAPQVPALQANVAPAIGDPNLTSADADLLETLPEHVQDFVDLYPMERTINSDGRSSLVSTVFGLVTTLYRATNLNTNQTVCLRRVHSFQPSISNSKSLLATVEAWRKIQCANMVRLLQVFTTKEFGDNSLILVYQYFPQAVSMMQQYFSDALSSAFGSGNSIYGFSATNRPYSQQHAILKTRLLPENLIWHYIIQISSSLRLIHSQGLAYRILDPTKILITTSLPKCPPSQLLPTQYPRIRLNACGLCDLISLDQVPQEQTKAHCQQLQQDDLVSFGRLCLALATNSLANAQREQWETALELVTRTYSSDLKALIVTLLSIKDQTPRRTVNDIMPMIGARFYVQLNLSYEIYDNAQAELEREALNGRLFRLLVKLSMINDRPELRLDPSWSETGDRYMLKLFRDYLFHQVTEEGTPWLDTGHVVSALIKFDVGSPEKICLISRDEQHVLVVSFAELKKCFESAFNDLQG